MKSQMLVYYFKQLKVFFLIIIGFSILFMNIVASSSPKLEALGLIGLFVMVSITLGLLQTHTNDTQYNSDLYLLHLPMEKSHVWLTKTICGVVTLLMYYLITNLLSVFNPSTPLIDLMIIQLGLSTYFLARVISTFVSDIVQGVFLTLFIIAILWQIFTPISFSTNPNGLAFPLNFYPPYLLGFFILSISSSYFFGIKYFRKSIN